MSWVYWASLGLMVLGFVLFLYGANNYNAAVGWTGGFVFVFGVITALVFYVYDELTKPGDQKS
jgi:membrane-bound ClpP family serine protease